jgi:DNA polymerase-4
LATALLQAEMPFPKSVRLLGVSLSSLQTQGNDDVEPQLDLPI